MNKKRIILLIDQYGAERASEERAGEHEGYTTMKRHYDAVELILKEIETELDKVSQELDAMRPVVQAAEVWADSFTGTQAHDALEAAVDAYRAMNLTGATP